MIRYIFAAFLTLSAASAHAQMKIQEVTSPGGIDAWLVQEETIPFVALEIIIDGGASLDMPGKRGATNLMMALLEEGSGDLSAREFQATLEVARLGCDPRDIVCISTGRAAWPLLRCHRAASPPVET